MSSSNMAVESTFNEIFNRPPTFCEDCGELLDFEIITNDNVRCQKCGGETPLENIKVCYLLAVSSNGAEQMHLT